MVDLIKEAHRLENEQFSPIEEQINLFSKSLFDENKRELGDFERSVLDEIKLNGISICHVDDFHDEDMANRFLRLKEYYDRFKNDSQIQDRIINYQSGKSLGGSKDFEINAVHLLGRHLDLGDGVIEFFLSDTILTMASSYFNKCAKMFHCTSWIHMSSPHKNSRVSSMNWHRDPEAIRIMKVFLLVEDVLPENGPFQYIRSSHIDGKYSSLQEYRVSGRYPSDSMIRQNVNDEDIISLIGKAGTIAFVDTFGFHRGGFVQEGLRQLAQGVFLKPEVIRLPTWSSQRIKININDHDNLSNMARYAVDNNFGI